MATVTRNVSEHTALLPSTGSRFLPPLDTTIRRVRRLETSQLTLSDLCPDELVAATAATRTAYALLVLLRLRTNGARRNVVTQDVWDGWSKEKNIARDAEALELRILDLWKQFLEEYRSPREIEDVLWLGFPVTKKGKCLVRVVDLLRDSASDALLSHRLVHLSVVRTWKYGRIPDPEATFWQRIDLVCTPRVAHSIELLCHLAYLAVLLHFLLYPPARPIITSGLQDSLVREVVLVLFPITAIARRWSPRTIPFILAFLAFASCLPSVPFPGDFTFAVLLVAFAIHIWQLHLPSTPSPIFILPPEGALPLSTLLWHSISRVLYPVLIFFFPVLLLTWFLMYFSLADTFLQHLNLPGTQPSPINTRVAFALLFGVEFLILIPFLFVPLLILPLSSANNDRNTWDRYSLPVGLEARKAYLKAVVEYASPCYLPPPVNVLGLIIGVFSVMLHLMGLRSGYLVVVKKILWTVVVVPVAAVIASLWGLERWLY